MAITVASGNRDEVARAKAGDVPIDADAFTLWL